MKKTFVSLSLILIGGLFSLSCSVVGNDPVAAINEAGASSQAIKRDSLNALRILYNRNPEIHSLGVRAKGVLVFPKVTELGLGLGVQGGNGVLFLNGGKERFFRTSAANYGFRAGVREFALVFFLMNDDSVRKVDMPGGWEVERSAVTVVGESDFSNERSAPGRSGIYAMTFNQSGLIAGCHLKKVRIAPFHPAR